MSHGLEGGEGVLYLERSGIQHEWTNGANDTNGLEGGKDGGG